MVVSFLRNAAFAVWCPLVGPLRVRLGARAPIGMVPMGFLALRVDTYNSTSASSLAARVGEHTCHVLLGQETHVRGHQVAELSSQLCTFGRKSALEPALAGE